jgi:hypothetical protein
LYAVAAVGSKHELAQLAVCGVDVLKKAHDGHCLFVGGADACREFRQ